MMKAIPNRRDRIRKAAEMANVSFGGAIGNLAPQ